jgi:hypothetical protein
MDGIGICSVGKGHRYALRDSHYNADDEVNLQVRIQTAIATYQNNNSMHNTGPVGVLEAYCARPAIRKIQSSTTILIAPLGSVHLYRVELTYAVEWSTTFSFR